MLKLIIGLMTLAIVVLTAATGVRAHHEWFRWGTDGTALRLEVVNNLDARWTTHLDPAIAVWSQRIYGNPVRLTAMPGNGAPCQEVEGKIQICNQNFGEDGMTGGTRAYLNDAGVVTAMVIEINDYYFPDDWSVAAIEDRQQVICHELGHAIGLDHDTSGENLGTCMDYSNDRWYPNRHDFEQLVEMYGPYRPAMTHSIRVGGVAR